MGGRSALFYYNVIAPRLKLQREEINEIIGVKNCNPKFGVKLEEIKKISFEQARKMNSVSREMIGARIYGIAKEMAEIFV